MVGWPEGMHGINRRQKSFVAIWQRSGGPHQGGCFPFRADGKKRWIGITGDGGSMPEIGKTGREKDSGKSWKIDV